MFLRVAAQSSAKLSERAAFQKSTMATQSILFGEEWDYSSSEAPTLTNQNAFDELTDSEGSKYGDEKAICSPGRSIGKLKGGVEKARDSLKPVFESRPIERKEDSSDEWAKCHQDLEESLSKVIYGTRRHTLPCRRVTQQASTRPP